MRVALVAVEGPSAGGTARRGRRPVPSLALLTLAGITPDRFELTYHELHDPDGTAELPDCDLAALTAVTATVKDAYRLARRFRDRGTPTVLGGLHATVLPEEAERHVDAVVVGEGELAWPRLLADAERGRLARRYSPGRRQLDLGRAPLPRLDLIDAGRYERLPLQTARGCPWRCEFCGSSVLLARRYRVKPVGRVVAELRELKRVAPQPAVALADDNTFVRKPHARALMEAFAEEGGVRWTTETDVSVADDEELLRLMRQAGCTQVRIGFESPSAPALRGVELRRDWKRARLASYCDAVARLRAHGIGVVGCFVLGLDGGTETEIDAIADFVLDSALDEAEITVATPLPGTPLYARLALEGRLLDPTAWERCTLFDVNFRPMGLSPEELGLGLARLRGRLADGAGLA